MSPAQLLIFLVAFLCYGTFAWSVFGVFKSHNSNSPVGLKVLKFGAGATAFAQLWAISGSTRLKGLGVSRAIASDAQGEMIWSMPLMAFFSFVMALNLFWWAVRSNQSQPLTLAFHEDQPQHLNQKGPYRWVRHPFYLAYLMSYWAGFLATQDKVLLFFIGMMTVIYIFAALKEENKFLQSPLRAEYRRYQKRTGMFLPRLFSGLFHSAHQK